MQSKSLFVLMVLALMVGAFAGGCGGSEEVAAEPGNGEPASDPGTPEEDHDEAESRSAWMYLESMVELVEIIDEMTWSVDGSSFHYAYKGSDTVNGVTADVIFVDAEGEAATFWLDRSGEILQAEIEGEKVPLETMAYASMYMMAPLLPFQLSIDPNLQSALAGDDAPGWNILQRSKTRENIGGQQAYLYRVILNGKDPFDVGAGEYTIEFRFADFGHTRLLLGWDTVEGAGKGEEYMTFAVDSISFR